MKLKEFLELFKDFPEDVDMKTFTPKDSVNLKNDDLLFYLNYDAKEEVLYIQIGFP